MPHPPPTGDVTLVRVTRAPQTGVADATVGLVVSGLPTADRVVERLRGSGDAPGASVAHGRLAATVAPSRLVAAVEDVIGGDRAADLATRVRAALDAYTAGPPDLWTPAGTLPTSRRTVLLGVLNVTPDSFFDGGVHLAADHPRAAVEDGMALVEAGADVVDVGGESTRPGADPVEVEEELRRVVPVVSALAERGVVVSVDTTKSVVARAAVEAGAAIVNDVSAGALDDTLPATVAELGVAYVLMHMRGLPRTMQRDPRYDDVVAEVHDHLGLHLRRLAVAGLPPERVVIDPGIGFGKSVEHNVLLMRHLRELTGLGRPVLVGASRKSFLGHLTDAPDPADRLESSLAAAVLAVVGGASIVRVHDVAETRRVTAIADAVARPTAPTEPT